MRISTQVAWNTCCFDMLLSNERKLFFPIECKLEAHFGRASTEQCSQLERYAAEVRNNPAPRKGLVSLTARNVESTTLGDIKFVPIRWTDVISLCESHANGSSVAAALTKHFVDLLRFLKADRGLDSGGRLRWKCELCGFQTAGQGIYSHEQKHQRLATEYLRKEFDKALEPHLPSIQVVIDQIRSTASDTFIYFSPRIEMKNYQDSQHLLHVIRESRVAPEFWRYLADKLPYSFSNSAFLKFTEELTAFAGVEQFTWSHYFTRNIGAALAHTAMRAQSAGNRHVSGQA